jgi:hypothetical protein
VGFEGVVQLFLVVHDGRFTRAIQAGMLRGSRKQRHRDEKEQTCKLCKLCKGG